MPTRKRRRPTTAAIVLMAALSATGVGALGYYVAQRPNVPPEERRVEEQHQNEPKVDVKVDQGGTDEVVHGQSAEILTPHYKNEELTFTREKTTVPAGEDAKVFALNAYLSNAGVTSKDAKALSVDVKDGVAMVSFNEAITGEGYGSDDERTLVNGIAAVMGQFKDVDKVVLTIGGKPIESFGHLDLTEPIKVKR